MKKERFKYKLFGRFKGRKRNEEINSNLINLYKINTTINLDANCYNILDIGSGSGENAINLSDKYTEARIITCELFKDGNLNLINKIIENNIKNINLFHGNVLEFLDNINCPNIFDEVWILFPDPWPKMRHHKRRLINPFFLKKISYFIKKSGNLMIATDSKSYTYSILKSIYEAQDYFLWQNPRINLWDYQYLNLPKTKFYKKALKSNRNSMFFRLNKI